MPDTLRVGEFELRVQERLLLRAGQPQSLGGRAFDLLLTLARHHDRVVGKQELMAQVWPGLVVEDNNLTVQLSALRKLLGPACITTLPGRGYRLTAGVDAPAVAPAAAQAAPGPATAAPLFGRADDLACLRQAVQSHALVTLLGPSGIGKTSLARAFVAELAPTLADGAVLAELAPLTEPALVAVTVAAALGLPPAAGASGESLAAAAAGRQGLLVLDNCEHLIDAAASLAQALLAGAPGLRLLATSQVPLRLPQEQPLRLGSLATSAVGEGVAGARQAGAVALFEARARASDPSFELTHANVDGVVDICRRLDGVALAIELAAARVRWLGVDGLRERLQAPAGPQAGEQLHLLSGGARLALPRHQTLRAALSWSCALLSADEQAVFRRLGVFTGGFSLAAVQQVAGDAAIDEWVVADLLGHLIDRSLVVADLDGSAARAAGAPAGSAGEARYSLLQSLREYALEQLAAQGETGHWRERHAAWYCELAFSKGGPTTALRSTADRWPLVLEHDNLRSALDWMSDHDPVRALAMAAELLPFWRERGHHAEAQRRCTPLLAHPANQRPSAERARSSITLCALARERNLPALIRPLASIALADARTLGLRSLEALGHIWLAHADQADDDPVRAITRFRQALAIQRELDEPARVAESLTNLSCMLIEQGELGEVGPMLADALALYRAAENAWGQGFVHTTLGEAALAAGDADAALVHAERALALHRRLQHQHRLSTSLLQCAQLLVRLGRAEEARTHLAEVFQITRTHGFHDQTTLAFLQGALLAAVQGLPHRAATLLGAAQAGIDRGGALDNPLDQAEFARARQLVQAALSEADWHARWEAGLALPEQQAQALALEDAPPTARGLQ